MVVSSEIDRETTRAGLRLELFVGDVARSAAFYVEVLGFAVERQSGAGYVSVTRGGATLGVNAASALSADHPARVIAGERAGRGVEIVVVVDDIEQACVQAVASGWVIAEPLALRPWGLKDFRVIDPDGFYVRMTGASGA